MSENRLMQVLLRPLVSEKATTVAETNGQVVFRVATDATKVEVAKAVELMFDVKVKGVQIANVKGKTRRFRQIPGRRPNWKKAYVSLAEGHDIDFLGSQ